MLPLGFTVSAFYYLPRENQRRGFFVLNIVLYLAAIGALACCLLIFYPELLRLLVGSDTLTPFSGLIGVIIFLWLFSGLLETIATANQDVRLSTIFIVGAQLTKTLFILVGASFFRSISALLYAAILQGITESAMLLWYLDRSFPGYWRRFDPRLFREQASYVAPLDSPVSFIRLNQTYPIT